METYAIFANGLYWGRWTASNADEAIRNAAEDIGTDGDTTGMTAQVLKRFHALLPQSRHRHHWICTCRGKRDRRGTRCFGKKNTPTLNS
jgi:hypothetical protein